MLEAELNETETPDSPLRRALSPGAATTARIATTVATMSKRQMQSRTRETLISLALSTAFTACRMSRLRLVDKLHIDASISR